MGKRFYVYWASAFVFSILFGEIIGPLIAGHALPLFQFFIPFVIYYGLLSFVFALFANRIKVWKSLAIFFVYGVIAEMLLFKNVKGIFDIAGILFFGLFYVFLFGVPLWFARKIVKGAKVQTELKS
jgi:hypothetical protein